MRATSAANSPPARGDRVPGAAATRSVRLAPAGSLRSDPRSRTDEQLGGLGGEIGDRIRPECERPRGGETGRTDALVDVALDVALVTGERALRERGAWCRLARVGVERLVREDGLDQAFVTPVNVEDELGPRLRD